jgi:sporulation-control protein spo0M
MLGMFNQQNLRFQLETRGEQWRQGEKLEGELSVSNNGSEQAQLTNVFITLKCCQLKDIRANENHGLDLQMTPVDPSYSLSPGEMKKIPFSFLLDQKTPLTDLKQSAYIFYGDKDIGTGHLQVQVQPLALYGEILKIIETFYRFKIKKFVGKKASVEYTLIPPTAREWAQLKNLLMTFELQENFDLHLKLEARGQKIDLSNSMLGGEAKTVKTVKSWSKLISSREYTFDGRAIDSDKVRNVFEDILSRAKSELSQF